MGYINEYKGVKGITYEAQADRVDPLTGKKVRKSRTFKSEREAKDWIAEFETKIIGGKAKVEKSSTVKLTEMIDAYIKKLEKSEKRSKQDDINRLKVWQKSQYAEIPLPALTYKVLIDYIADRRECLNPSGAPIAEQTIKHELQVISNVYEFAMLEHEELINPVKRIPKDYKPNGSREVDVRISSENQALLLAGLAKNNNKHFSILAELGIETAMRQGEILRLTRGDLKFEDKNSIHVVATDYRTSRGITKPYTRFVALTDRAHELLTFALPIKDKTACIWGENFNKFGLTTAFTEVAEKLPGMEHATFHSTRHEAISRMVEAGMQREDIMKISGHKTHSQLNRYYNARPAGLHKSIQVMNKPKVVKEAKRLYRRWFYYKQFACKA